MIMMGTRNRNWSGEHSWQNNSSKNALDGGQECHKVFFVISNLKVIGQGINGMDRR